ncbi:MAG: hypothetical protein BJ554DRAFT_3680, partial [Olpidium bornovanus]
EASGLRLESVVVVVKVVVEVVTEASSSPAISSRKPRFTPRPGPRNATPAPFAWVACFAGPLFSAHARARAQGRFSPGSGCPFLRTFHEILVHQAEAVASADLFSAIYAAVVATAPSDASSSARVVPRPPPRRAGHHVAEVDVEAFRRENQGGAPAAPAAHDAHARAGVRPRGGRAGEHGAAGAASPTNRPFSVCCRRRGRGRAARGAAAAGVAHVGFSAASGLFVSRGG